MTANEWIPNDSSVNARCISRPKKFVVSEESTSFKNIRIWFTVKELFDDWYWLYVPRATDAIWRPRQIRSTSITDWQILVNFLNSREREHVIPFLYRRNILSGQHWGDMDVFKAVETYVTKMISTPAAMKVLLLDSHTVCFCSADREFYSKSVSLRRRLSR